MNMAADREEWQSWTALCFAWDVQRSKVRFNYILNTLLSLMYSSLTFPRLF